MEGKQRTSEEVEWQELAAVESTSELKLDQVLTWITHLSRELLQATSGGIYLLNKDRQQLRLKMHSGEGPTIFGKTLNSGEGLPGRVLKTGEAQVVSNYSEWVGRSSIVGGSPSQSALVIPLRAAGETIGVLYVSDVEGRQFDKNDVQLITGLAGALRLAYIAGFEHVTNTKTAAEELIREISQLPLPERQAVVEKISESIREETGINDSLAKSETQQHTVEEKRAAVNRLRGVFKTDRRAPTDEELKEDYITYLAKKYS
jgi:putative methionine-R-sulfoxide reductase with GAF domain